MKVSRTGCERTLSPPPPPPPQAVSRREPARTRPQPKAIQWYTGMTCPVPECRQTAPFRYLDNYLRHYQEIHQPLSTFYGCPVMVGHFRVRRRGDLTRHLRKIHPELSEGRIRALVNKCQHTRRPNPAYVDPGNLLPPGSPDSSQRFEDLPAQGATASEREPRPTSTVTSGHGGARPKRRTEPGSYPWPRSASPMDTVRTEVTEYPRQHEIPSGVRRPRNEDTGKKTLQPKRTVALPRSVTGAHIGEPERWIPENLGGIPSFLTWLANFQAELDNVREEARRRLVREGDSASLRRVYEEGLARRGQADAGIARLLRGVGRRWRGQTEKGGRDDKHRRGWRTTLGVFL